MKLQAIFEKMMEKRKAIEKIAKEMKFKYEYDSDEEVDPENGTWEHTLRKAEMEATKQWAGALTEMADGKHHIGDFLPPSELSKFMSTYQVRGKFSIKPGNFIVKKSSSFFPVLFQGPQRRTYA
jgi:splicing factor 4